MQDGMSRPHEVGSTESRPIFWAKELVKQVGSLIKKGLQFFDGHNADNSTSGRQEMGRVVGRFEKEINGKLNQIVIGYFPDKNKVKNFDVCSIESEIIVGENKDFDIAKKVLDISGIALGNSNIEKPGFEGALRLASLQCFDRESNENVIENNQEKKTMAITYEEFLNAPFEFHKRAIRDRQIYPSQLGYTEEDVKKDFTLGSKLIEAEKNLSTIQDLEKQLNDEKEARQKEKTENFKISATQRLDSLIPEGFTQKQKDFVIKSFDVSKLSELTEEGLKKYVENSTEEYKKYANIFGMDDDSQISSQPDNTENLLAGNDDKIEESILNEILEKQE